MKAIKSIAQVFRDTNVRIDRIWWADTKVRIDAHTINHVPDVDNSFSGWASTAYANRLSLERYGKTVDQLKGYFRP